MAARLLSPIRDKDLKGLSTSRSSLERLHDDATARDHAGNRRLFYDQYGCLLLLFFFNPIVKSLRGIQQASELDKVQRLLGCERVSLSEASRVLAPELLHALIGEIATQAPPLVDGKEAEALRGLTAVDGSFRLISGFPARSGQIPLDIDRNRATLPPFSYTKNRLISSRSQIRVGE